MEVLNLFADLISAIAGILAAVTFLGIFVLLALAAAVFTPQD